MRRVLAASLALAALFEPDSAIAHHSPSAVFDMTKPFVVSGTLTKIEWVNPHIDLFLEAKGADGCVEVWKIESQPPSEKVKDIEARQT